MGQKVNPIGIRLGIIKDWTSTWYANSKDYADALCSDIKIREFIRKKLAKAFANFLRINSRILMSEHKASA